MNLQKLSTKCGLSCTGLKFLSKLQWFDKDGNLPQMQSTMIAEHLVLLYYRSVKFVYYSWGKELFVELNISPWWQCLALLFWCFKLTHFNTEKQESSWFQLCHHCWHRRLSLWKPMMPPMTTKLASWFSVNLFKAPKPADQIALQWHHNERNGTWNHWCLDCLLSRLFRCKSKKTSKLLVTGLCEGNPLVRSGFPSQRTSNMEMFPLDDFIMECQYMKFA